MDSQTVMSAGVKVRGRDKRNENKEGSADFVSDGSLIEVGVNQFMILTDGGKIVDYTSEPGYYKVDNKNAPSMFNGGFSEAIEETFNRLRFGGVPSSSQKVYFINLQEIKDIAFGTPNPINYFDNFYNAELYLRTNGYFSIRITDPIKFYAEAIPKNMDHVSIVDIQKLYIAEFLTAVQTAVNKMSMDGIRISHVTSKAMELANYMGEVLDESWNEKRGMQIESVGINSITYDEQSKKLIDMRNQGAMLSDPLIREGYVQGSVARGLEAAGSNSAGSAAGFLLNTGIISSLYFIGSFSLFIPLPLQLYLSCITIDFYSVLFLYSFIFRHITSHPFSHLLTQTVNIGGDKLPAAVWGKPAEFAVRCGGFAVSQVVLATD